MLTLYRSMPIGNIINTMQGAGSALADAGPNARPGRGPNARPGRGAPPSSDFMTLSCSVNRVTIVVERKYALQH